MFLICDRWSWNMQPILFYFVSRVRLFWVKKKYSCKWTTQRDVSPQNIQLPHIATLSFYLRLLTPLGLLCSDFRTKSLGILFKNPHVLLRHPLITVVFHLLLFVKLETRADSPGENFTFSCFATASDVNSNYGETLLILALRNQIAMYSLLICIW